MDPAPVTAESPSNGTSLAGLERLLAQICAWIISDGDSNIDARVRRIRERFLYVLENSGAEDTENSLQRDITQLKHDCAQLQHKITQLESDITQGSAQLEHKIAQLEQLQQEEQATTTLIRAQSTARSTPHEARCGSCTEIIREGEGKILNNCGAVSIPGFQQHSNR